MLREFHRPAMGMHEQFGLCHVCFPKEGESYTFASGFGCHDDRKQGGYHCHRGQGSFGSLCDIALPVEIADSEATLRDELFHVG